MIGRLRDLTRGFDDEQIITIAVKADFRETYEDLKDHEVAVDIRRYRRHRSLEANAYAWVLIGQIAAKLQDMDPKAGWTPEKVYQNAIRDVGGAYQLIGMKTEAVDTFRQGWTAGHIGRMVEVLDGSVKAGWSNVKVYYGSSDFDSGQMSRFINILIQDAESLGIPTITDKEYERMIGNWGKTKETRSAV